MGEIIKIEYASNDDLSPVTTTDYSQAVNREDGSQGINTNLSQTVLKRIKFPTPYTSDTDILELQVSRDKVNWDNLLSFVGVISIEGTTGLTNSYWEFYDAAHNNRITAGIGLTKYIDEDFIAIRYGQYRAIGGNQQLSNWSDIVNPWYWRVAKKTFTNCEDVADYNSLINKPKINGVELVGDSSFNDLGLDISNNCPWSDDMVQNLDTNVSNTATQASVDAIGTNVNTINSNVTTAGTNIQTVLTGMGVNTDAAGTTTIFARLNQIYTHLTTYLSSTISGYISTINTNVSTALTRLGSSSDTANASGTTLFALLKFLATTWTSTRAANLDAIKAKTDLIGTTSVLGATVKSIQRGSTSISASNTNANTDVTISSVVMGKSLVLLSSSFSGGGNSAFTISASLTSGTNVRISSQSGNSSALNGTYTVKWQVIEFY